ncbi:hypothetical protein CWE13_00330 [Aliidiomarina shirensis]|uniref:Uncharacterized protein n=1 Tax=Aliidiomarina shirensis TaxID=1048642 RepID=A0A432WWJ4_9GAMM|nr:hypothetical protein [Aliidiomarina shirensis]RUO38135.1 hypothetical protein CWE13_00330 [Aliidiomarina shirensis]
MNNDEKQILMLTYKADIDGRAVTIKQLWNPNSDNTREHLAEAVMRSSNGFIKLHLAKTCGM